MLNGRSGLLPASLIVGAYTALGGVTPASPEVRAGVVTALQGAATVTHASLPEPVPLARRDAVYLRDRIATRERSLAQLLLGGKALVTVREWSTLTVNDVPRTATVELGVGRLAIAVAKDKMRSGDTVEIKTPNCVVAIRGTVVVAEVTQAPSQGATPGPFATTITVIRGVVEVTLLDPQSGRPLGAPVKVGPLGRVEANGTTPLHPQTIPLEAAQRLGSDFNVGQNGWPTVASPNMVQDQIDEALRLTRALAPIQGPTSPASVGVGTPGLLSPLANTSTTNPTVNPVVTPTAVAAPLGAAATATTTSLGASSVLPLQPNGLTAPDVPGTLASPASALPASIGVGTSPPLAPAIAPIMPSLPVSALPTPIGVGTSPPVSPAIAPIVPTTFGPKLPLQR
jgi:FecR-like protein